MGNIKINMITNKEIEFPFNPTNEVNALYNMPL